MKKQAQTIEELMESIDSLERKFDWDADKTAASFVVLHGKGNTLHKMVGYSSEIATSLANAMVSDEDVRAVVLGASQLYIDYEAEKLAPKIAPIIKHAEEMLKNLSAGSAAASEAQQVSFKKILS